ncbi:MAG TPA: GH92 family glycosyl hydrolase [Candidatus Sulfopaludibacter sp.]|jgi:predicted alpha-1,2-mannosidase|nr:GH92 family glycosyl hydrolase [Candidatus Sulfopaludibacter sp.]
MKLILPLSLACFTLAAQTAHVKEPVDYVNPNIGTIGHLLTATVPYVQVPHGMARIAPVTTPGTQDRYLADRIFGFPAGPATLAAYTGDNAVSHYDHDFETTTPFSYKVRLDDSDIQAEATATQSAAYFRFQFPAAAHAHISLNVRGGQVETAGADAVSGSGSAGRNEGAAGIHYFFYAEFSKALPRDASQASVRGSFVADFPTTVGEFIEVRVGTSHISVEQAKKNLQREIPKWGFDVVKAKTRAAWNQALSTILVKGGTEKQKTIFYTALYRTLCRMTDITEDGQYYSGYDQKVHTADGHDFYVDDGLWDTYRSAHPLSLLIETQRQLDMVRSYIRMYQQSGWMPSFPSLGGDRAVMIGHHSTALIADVYAKGYRDFDVEAAYAGMKKNAMESTLLPWKRGGLTDLDKVYMEKGFFPALAKGETETSKDVHASERRQAVSVTLENCYDDWCLSQVAKGLGKQDDYAYFLKRAHNYANVFNEKTGFMTPKSADGKWVEDFDPKLGGGQGGRAWFAECNSWVYTWHVQHDPAGLMALMGGKDKFAAKLEQLFNEQPGTSKFAFLGQFPDMTGLIGMYPQGNEPAFHIPYLFDYCGQPWKTQRRVRQIMDVWYGDGPLGICGDEDGGAMSSWYVLSAMGFYPVSPGQPAYEIGSPLFEETRITLDKGKIFTITARNVSAQNKYIQSAMLNGKAWDKPWFAHSDIAGGGSLVLVMGPKPNLTWGTGPDAAPPSMTK